MTHDQITYTTGFGLARTAGVTRPVIMRLLASGAIAPDAYLEYNGQRQPLFIPTRAVEILRLQARRGTSRK